MDTVYESRPWLKHYPDAVPPDLPLTSQTILDAFRASVHRRPEAAAVYYFDHILTYAQIDRLSNQLAAAFLSFDLHKGDRLILDLQNVPQFLIATYAAWKIGLIVVPLNPMYREKELLYFCQDSGARALVMQDDIAAKRDLAFLKETAVEQVVTTSALDFLPQNVKRPDVLINIEKESPHGTVDMLELIRGHQNPILPKTALNPDDTAFLTYTSGTTGTPKGAMNAHTNIAFTSRVFQKMLQMDANDVVLGVAPLFHVTGEVAHLAIAALVGAPLILFYRFDAAEALRLIERWQSTMTVAAITVYIALMNHPDIRKRDLSSMVKAYSGGAPVSEAIVARFESLTGCYIHNVYGMTETNSPSHITPLGRRAPVDPESGALSVGVPVPNCVMKIMDLEQGTRALPAGEVGEIVDSGPVLVPGYWRKPEETEHAIRDGWLYTGDVGKMDDDGWFYVVDRKKDMIVASGYKVWPRDVEDVLYQIPAVREAAVIGVPDPYRGETVKAFVALKEGKEGCITPDDIISFCKSRLAAYKYPREVEIIPEIPKTLTGKFLRRKLKE